MNGDFSIIWYITNAESTIVVKFAENEATHKIAFFRLLKNNSKLPYNKIAY